MMEWSAAFTPLQQLLARSFTKISSVISGEAG